VPSGSGPGGIAGPRLIASLEAERARLRAEFAAVSGQLADALAECERLAVQVCRHPAPVVDGGICRACGADVW
jgi:hypothetical protein